MTFADFSVSLQKIENTSLRNEIMSLLAHLFTQASGEEIASLVYLTLGILKPKYTKLEFNLAEKMVMRAVARAFQVHTNEVLASYKENGDLGITAESLASRRVFNSQVIAQLSVQDVYDRLVMIAMAEGQGSQERKIASLAELLLELDTLSVRYIVRMVLGKLRLGFSDKTILDALSFMEKGSKEGRTQLDWAYQVSPDIGAIARLVKLHGTSRVAQMVTVRYGVPVVPALAQRLKTADEMIAKMGTVAMEPKYDGTRVQIHFRTKSTAEQQGQSGDSLFPFEENENFEIKTFTRNLDENSFMFPELHSIAHQIRASEIILDSEAVGFDPQTKKLLPFQMTITRKRKHNIENLTATVPLKFFVFDILYKDGKSLIQEPFSQRRKLLNEAIVPGDVLEVDEYETTSTPQAVRAYHQDCLDQGLEGAMIKQIDGVYSPGRTGFNWVKFKEAEEAHGKLSDTIDGVVMGYYKGKGKRSGFGIGAFLIGILNQDKKIVTLAKIGTGLSDDQWREIKDRVRGYEVTEKPNEYGQVDKLLIPDVWIEPVMIVEVAADEVTQSPTHSAGWALRFPRLVRFRDDKSVWQATTLEELKTIF